MQNYLKKLSILLLGNFVASFGVFLCAISNKGVDPITVLFQGIMNTLGVSIGTASIIFNITLLIICLIVKRKSVKFGTILSFASFSVFLNLFMIKFDNYIYHEPTGVSWLVLFVGILLMGIGFSTSIFAGIGPVTADVALDILKDKTNLNIKFSKIILDLVCTALGVLLGGTFGIGTVLCVVFVGIIYSLNLKILSKIPVQKYKLINETY